MTIIIKDMDMPECCTKCPIAKCEYDFDTFECPLTSRLEYMSDDDSWNKMSNGSLMIVSADLISSSFNEDEYGED